jgi:GNAT superfamily N-acetyltransferase
VKGKDFFMALGTWWSGDSLPNLPTLPSFSILLSTDTQLISELTTLSLPEVEARFQNGNHIYLAFLEQIPVAYGWLADQTGSIDEIHLSFALPPRDCYLWDFLTLPAWRGRGVYPHFLQAIIRQEQVNIDRFWIMYVPGNHVAARSISKAGFIFVGDLIFTNNQISGITLFDTSERAHAGAALLNLPVVPNSK